MIQLGQRFPDFALPNQDGQITRLSDYAGKWLALWVYPKDDTPGCTLEGRGFSAAKNEFDQSNAAAVGISQDDVTSHKSFCAKHGFTVPLLSDTDASVLEAAGVEKDEFRGVKYWKRTTFLIDPHGIVRKVYENVSPDGHEKQVLEDLKSFAQFAA